MGGEAGEQTPNEKEETENGLYSGLINMLTGRGTRNMATWIQCI
jgi:hypothetical protein